jgi:hypothetical protein
MCNEISGQLERNPDDKELFQLAEHLFGFTVYFGDYDAFDFEPSKEFSITLRPGRQRSEIPGIGHALHGTRYREY